MKKLMFLIIAACMLPVICSAWPFTWQSTSSIYIPNGSGGTMRWPDTSSGYILSLYLSTDNQFNLGSDTLALQTPGADVAAGAGTFYYDGQNTDASPNIPVAGDTSYNYLLTVMYIGTPSSYTYYGVLGSTALPAVTPDPSTPLIVNVPGVTAGNVYSTFVAAPVPEPSTVGLLLVGAGLVALRRFRRG